MSSLQEHCEDCIRALGEPFSHVHEWLDELQAEYGPHHRPFRHHREGVEMVRAQWGDRAAQAAELHIKADCLGRVPTRDEYRNWGIDLENIEPEPD